jgi:hypothetical protein
VFTEADNNGKTLPAETWVRRVSQDCYDSCADGLYLYFAGRGQFNRMMERFQELRRLLHEEAVRRLREWSKAI